MTQVVLNRFWVVHPRANSQSCKYRRWEKWHLPGTLISPLLRWNVALNHPDIFLRVDRLAIAPLAWRAVQRDEAIITQEQEDVFPYYYLLLEGKLDDFDGDLLELCLQALPNWWLLSPTFTHPDLSSSITTWTLLSLHLLAISTKWLQRKPPQWGRVVHSVVGCGVA